MQEAIPKRPRLHDGVDSLLVRLIELIRRPGNELAAGPSVPPVQSAWLAHAVPREGRSSIHLSFTIVKF